MRSPRLRPGESIDDAVIVSLIGYKYIMRCPCQATFTIPSARCEWPQFMLCASCKPKKSPPAINPPRPRPLPSETRLREPTSDQVKAGVELLRSGRTIQDVARKIGVKPQSVEKWFFRWIVYPEWLAMKAKACSG